LLVAGGLCTLLAAAVVAGFFSTWAPKVTSPLLAIGHHGGGQCAPGICDGEPPWVELGGTWYWLRSPEQEKAAGASLFNFYCIRCHGVNGRGIWDIPGIPNFTNSRWQDSRTDRQLARIILEGRGAVMPPFRGALSLEEAWAVARYLRTFRPGTEMLRPDFDSPKDAEPAPQGTLPKPKTLTK
jgi:hypothetical protein